MNLNFFGVNETRLNNETLNLITPHWFPLIYVKKKLNKIEIKKWFNLILNKQTKN